MVNVSLVFRNLKKLKPTPSEISAIVAAIDDANMKLGGDLVAMLSHTTLTHGDLTAIGIWRRSIQTNTELRKKVIALFEKPLRVKKG